MADRYRALLEIGKTLTSTLSPEELYRVVYREASRVLETHGFYISLYDDEEGLATVTFYADQGEERSPRVRYPASRSEVIRTGRARLIADRRAEDPLLVLGDRTTKVTRSAVSAPMTHDGRLLGVVSVQSYRPNAYGEQDLELLRGIADLAAVALDNARTVGELERRRREAERIEEIGRAVSGSLDREQVLDSIIEATIELVDADNAAVWIVEQGPVARVAGSGGPRELPEGLEWPLTGPVAEALCTERRPVVVDDPELRTREHLPPPLRAPVRAGGSLRALPLTTDGELEGVLTATSGRARAFASEDLATLTRLAHQASVALQNARLHAHVRDLSLTDPLTGLPNRRHLLLHLRRQIAAARRGRPLATVLFDLDNFKRYNDTLGHVAGDEILRVVGEVLGEETRAMNLAARYGGDEFVTVVTDTDPQGVLAHADRITERIEDHPQLAKQGIGVSSGIAHFREEMEGPEELLEAADAALYQVKERRGGAAAPTYRESRRG